MCLYFKYQAGKALVLRFLAHRRGAAIPRGADVSTFHFCDYDRAIEHCGPLELGPDPLGLIGRVRMLP